MQMDVAISEADVCFFFLSLEWFPSVASLPAALSPRFGHGPGFATKPAVIRFQQCSDDHAMQAPVAAHAPDS